MSPTLQPGTPQNTEGTVTDAEPCGWSSTFLASTHVLTLIGTWGGGCESQPPYRTIPRGGPHCPPLCTEAQRALTLAPYGHQDRAWQWAPCWPLDNPENTQPSGTQRPSPAGFSFCPPKGSSRATRVSHSLMGRDLGNHVCGSGQSLAGKARGEPRTENMPGAAQPSLPLVQGPGIVRRLLRHERR